MMAGKLSTPHEHIRAVSSSGDRGRTVSHCVRWVVSWKGGGDWSGRRLACYQHATVSRGP